VAFAPPNTLATSGYDGTIIIWNMDSGVAKHAVQRTDAEAQEVRLRIVVVQ